ncbi:hypothetical protein IAD21_06240 [Abditibacteriota bacterium]|nr:hypothetical protein IAD21_06240 [Abditibacteriota bacterium]
MKSSTRPVKRKKARPIITQRLPERFNLTLRQRLARFVRKTLAFSKNLFMHIVVLRIYLHAYNHHQARSYTKSHPT